MNYRLFIQSEGDIMEKYSLTLEVLEGTYCVCKGLPTHLIGDMLSKSNFFSLTQTSDEVSIVCNEEIVPDYIGAIYEKGWKAIKVVGPLDFALVGILANISSLLTKAGISLFVISTYDTDYILVKNTTLAQAISALEIGGHVVKSL
jgi:hypothetical protein